MFNERRAANRNRQSQQPAFNKRNQPPPAAPASHLNSPYPRDRERGKECPKGSQRDSPYINRRDDRLSGIGQRRARNEGYENDRNRSKRGRYGGHNYDRNNRLQQAPVYPLESLRVEDSRWDICSPNLKGISARFAKSVGIFSSPSENRVASLTESEIKELLVKQHNLLKLRNERIHKFKLPGPNDSKVARKVIIKGIDFDKVQPEIVNKFLESFLASTVIPNVSYEELEITPTMNKEQKCLEIDCLSSLVATTLISFNMKYVKELDSTLIVERPYDYIAQLHTVQYASEDSTRDSEDSVKEEIKEFSDLICVNNLPLQISIQSVKEKLLKYGTLQSLVLLIDKLTYESNGNGFFSFKDLKSDGKKSKDIIAEISENEGWSCFLACENPKNHYYQDTIITLNNINDLVELKTHEISRHEKTSMIQLLNVVSIQEFSNLEKLDQVTKIFESELSQLAGFQELLMVKPPEGFKLQNDELQPEYGRIYVKFKSQKEAQYALNTLCGRKFHNRHILGSYLDDFDYQKHFSTVNDINFSEEPGKIQSDQSDEKSQKVLEDKLVEVK